MYTVFRVTHENFSFSFIEKIGAEMNALRNGVYEGLRKAGDGFACEISKSTLWVEQMQNIKDFLFLFKRQIAKLIRNNYEITVDIAIDSADFSDIDDRVGLFLFHSKDFLRALESYKVNYEISIYGVVSEK